MEILSKYYQKKIPVFPRGEKIPQRIIQTYFSFNEIPESITDNIERIKTLNPEWEYIFYDDRQMESFIAKEYPLLLPTFKKISGEYGAVKADFFRYLEIYKNGGVYLDIKSGITKPLNSSIVDGDQYILSNWSEWREADQINFGHYGNHKELSHIQDGEYQQWHIISVAGHPFLRSVILAMLRNISAYIPERHGCGRMGVLRLTGPIAYTLAIHSIKETHAHRFVKIRSEFGLEYLFDDKADHRLYFGNKHYTNCSNSIIKLGIVGIIASHAYRYARKVVHLLRRIF